MNVTLGQQQLSPPRLASVVAAVAASPALWRPLCSSGPGAAGTSGWMRPGPDPAYELWLLSWLPGQRTGFHDHGDAAGAFAVADGALLESTARPGRAAVARRALAAGAVRSFGPATCTMSATPGTARRSACTPTRPPCR